MDIRVHSLRGLAKVVWFCGAITAIQDAAKSSREFFSGTRVVGLPSATSKLLLSTHVKSARLVRMERITTNPEQCGGRPCIRGMRIRVVDVLDLLSNGLTPQQVLQELPDLEPEDIQAALKYASRKLNHPVLTAA